MEAVIWKQVVAAHLRELHGVFLKRQNKLTSITQEMYRD